MRSVFVLHHTTRRGGNESYKLIGIYSSRLAAEDAVRRLRHKPGFQRPDGEFAIDEYVLDEDNWTEGFGVSTD